MVIGDMLYIMYNISTYTTYHVVHYVHTRYVQEHILDYTLQRGEKQPFVSRGLRVLRRCTNISALEINL